MYRTAFPARSSSACSGRTFTFRKGSTKKRGGSFCCMNGRTLKGSITCGSCLPFSVCACTGSTRSSGCASRFFCRDVDLACDETVTAALSDSARCDYAETLLRLSGENPLFPLPAFSEPEPEARIKRVLRWKKPAETLCAAVLVLAIVFGAGLLVSPYPKEAIFDQRYVVSGILYAHKQYDFTYSPGAYPCFSLTKDHLLYERQPGGSFDICGELQETKLEGSKLLSIFDPEWTDDVSVRAMLRPIKSGWLVQEGDSSNTFALVLRSGSRVLLAQGYGDFAAGEASVRWLFELKPDTSSALDLSVLSKAVKSSGVFLESDTVRVYGVYESSRLPDLIITAFDGTLQGEADFYRDDVLGVRGCSVWVDTENQPLTSWTAVETEWPIPYSVITSHCEDLAEVRAVWDGVELSRAVTSCPALVVLEWPEELASHTDTSPNICFYNAASEEIPRN